VEKFYVYPATTDLIGTDALLGDSVSRKRVTPGAETPGVSFLSTTMQTTLTNPENDSGPTDEQCGCTDLPDGVPCADCYIAGRKEWSA
jgi:hypothetical protein